MKSDQAIDRIVYTTSFKEQVQGRLKARFHLDADGVPQYELDDDDRRLRHYLIDLFLESPRSKEIKRVRYLLDDPSFIDPKRSSRDADNQFRETISSYGNLEILVTVEMAAGKYEQPAWLSHMLENGHADDMTDAIDMALQRITVN
jgi:hypothetical protein